VGKFSYFTKEIEKGQFLVLFALLLIVFLAIIAFAIDGGRVYVEQRRTQNAADNAALGTALALCRGQENYVSEGFAVANENGYDNNGTSNTVSINIPPVYGASAGRSGAVEAIEHSEIPSTFANIVGISSFDLTGRAVTTCNFGGNFAIFAGGTDCDKQIEWSGSTSLVNGNVHSNNIVHISGSENEVNGNITYVDPPPPHDNYLDPLTTLNPAEGNPSRLGNTLPYPVDFQFDDYAPGSTNALAAGSQYYNFGSQKIDIGTLESYPDGPLIEEVGENWVLSDGLYYTTDDIDISIGKVIGENVTFVSGGAITISGSDQYLSHYVDGLLAFSNNEPDNHCSDTVVRFNGSGFTEWNGIVFAPFSVIDMSGSDSTAYNGSLIGYTIKIGGSNLELAFDPDLFTPQISLVE